MYSQRTTGARFPRCVKTATLAGLVPQIVRQRLYSLVIEPPPPMSQPQDVILDPVAAYDAWAPCYTRYSQSRLPYLQAVERLILARITGARSLLDVGAGDGSRALRIAKSAGIGETVLLEPSEGMRGHGTVEGE